MITPSFSLTATERVLPAMALDFTTASLDSRVTFTRSGNTATVVNSSGLVVPINANLPRFDFNPVTLACKGLLIEESRTNLLLNSSQFNTGWTLAAGVVVTQDTVTSPEGITNADTIDLTAAANFTGVSQSTVVLATTATYTGSVFLKAGTNSQILVAVFGFGGTFQSNELNVNLSNGTITSGTGGTIENYGNGWYRVSVVMQNNGTNLGVSLNIRRFTTSGTTFAYGGQLEVGAFQTSYIPTTSSQVTRTADVATMTGANFSSWYNASEGSFLVVADRIFTGNFVGFIYPFTANDNTTANEIAVVSSSGTALMQIGMAVGGVSQLDFVSGSFNAEPSKMIAAYKQNNTQFGMNGLSKTTDTSCNIPTVTQLAIGRRTTSGYWAGHILKLSYYPQRLISAELAAFSK